MTGHCKGPLKPKNLKCWPVQNNSTLVDDGYHPLLQENKLPTFTAFTKQRAVKMWIDIGMRESFSDVLDYVYRLTKYEETLPPHLKLLSLGSSYQSIPSESQKSAHPLPSATESSSNSSPALKPDRLPPSRANYNSWAHAVSGFKPSRPS